MTLVERSYTPAVLTRQCVVVYGYGKCRLKRWFGHTARICLPIGAWQTRMVGGQWSRGGHRQEQGDSAVTEQMYICAK